MNLWNRAQDIDEWAPKEKLRVLWVIHLQSLGVGEPFTNALTTDRFLSFQGSVCKVSTQDSEKFDEEVKSLVTAWH